MRLTGRCMDMLRLVRVARWLSTGQVRRRFFPRATVSAARRRLRRLVAAGYLRKRQENRMREALFTLGREARRVLETDEDGGKQVVLERMPPKQMEHMAGINEIRIAAELSGELSYFFAAWELAGIGWKYPIVPDAIFRMANRTFGLEYDRGAEGLRYFMSKIASYRRGLPGFPLSAVLIVVDRRSRLETLSRAVADDRGRFLFTTIDAIRDRGMLAPIYYRHPGTTSGSLTETRSLEVSRRENGFAATSHGRSRDCEESGAPF